MRGRAAPALADTKTQGAQSAVAKLMCRVLVLWSLDLGRKPPVAV